MRRMIKGVSSFTRGNIPEKSISGKLGSDVNCGAAGSANASVCSACPAGSYSSESGNASVGELSHFQLLTK
jgi:hypothetical protein